VKPDPALERTARIVVLRADAFEHACRAVVHADGHDDSVFAQWCTQELRGS
jgi:hypothetical protein